MITEQRKIFFIIIWHLVAVVLLGIATLSSFAEVKEDVTTAGSNFIHLEDATSFHLLQQYEHNQHPGLPQNGFSSEYLESEEESKLKEGIDDDFHKETHNFRFPFALFSKSDSGYSLYTNVLGKQLPLFLLFHCWKSFLA